MTFEEFYKQHKVTVDLRPIPSRTDGSDFTGDDKTPEPCHFAFTLNRDGKSVYSGEYSVGAGIAEAWARKNKSRFNTCGHTTRDFLSNPPPRNRSIAPRSDYWNDIREQFGRAVARDASILPAHGILTSLVMDGMGSDQNFADWAGDLGYSDYSIKAKAIWEACNDIRRSLNSVFPADLWECEE